MKLHCIGAAAHGGWAALLLGLFIAGQSWAADKVIRLRNQPITTSEKGLLAPALAAAPASGLYLLQLQGPIQPEWRAELAQAGVELLWYVPEDAFVARLAQTDLAALQARPYLRWLGEYRSELKVHDGIFTKGLALVPDAPVKISVLLAPKARLAELTTLRRAWPRMERVSRTAAGLVWHGTATPNQVQALAGSSAVLWIERAAQPKLFDELATKIVAGDDLEFGTPALVHQLGFDGTGVTVSVADSGLNNGDAETMHPDLAGRATVFFQYGTLTDAADEHSHGTHVAGIIAGNGAVGETDEEGALYGLGVAPNARIVTQRLFDGAGGYEPPSSMATMTRDALRAGAEIGSNSWGDDTHGRYDLFAMEFDALVRDADDLAFGDQPYILEFSAGNAGPGAQTIGSPAVGKNVIATGASQNNRVGFYLYEDGSEAMADFSSRGPCEDGRIKPDIVAPGTWIASLKSESATDENAWSPISYYYLYMGGTSQAGPHASGAAAVFVQYYRATHTNQTPSPALVKAALINSAWDLDDTVETDPAPNSDEGWGRVDLTQIIGAARQYIYVDQTATLATGQTYEQRVIVSSASEPLKVTLTYTDVPGLPAAIPALVNDLDLEVIGPDGNRYHGNQFLAGESVANPSGFDVLNNVEGVLLYAPAPGEYLVRVRARNVAMDARADSLPVDQDFALVISGLLPLPGVGAVFMDRAFYRAPSQIKLMLYDSDLGGQGTVTVQMRSGTETNGEPLVLRASGSAGLFTGVVATVTGPAAVDGQLQIKHGDWIEARYQDVSAGQTRMATAQADFLVPVISNVSVTNRFGRMVISWSTDEPATGAITFGTNTTVTSRVIAPRPGVRQEVELGGLIPEQHYLFFLAAEDLAGNRATNNNGGQWFAFTAVAPAGVLLVDDYYVFSGDDSPVVSLQEYTDPLDAAGVSYEVWDVATRGYPTTNDLGAFKVVWWRVNDSLWGGLFGYQGLLSPQQSALTTYVNSGGGLFMASMELLSRLGTSESSLAFKSNVLQVAAYTEDTGLVTLEGLEFDSMTSGILMDLNYDNYLSPLLELLGQTENVADTVIPTTNAVPVLYAEESGGIVGLRYPSLGQDSTGRVVFMTFPIDAVPMAGDAPNNRASLLRGVLEFLAPGQGGAGTVALDRSHYTIPSLVTIEVGDADLQGQGALTITARSTTATNGISVELTETVRPGLFRGRVTLVAATNSPAPGQLLARDGDRLLVEYFDASRNMLVKTAAAVDTIAPHIFGVTAEADYEDITVTWSTDEDTEALVQYGESPSALALTRTAYRATRDNFHELLLPGLLPDKNYYFQVVSRDAAGNAVVDDNGGQYYTARTLRPLTAPLAESFDLTDGGWTVYSGDDSMTAWTWGAPNNGWETEAHSPPNAWGSNLEGRRIDWAETFLISPAIQLTGGNQVRLKFWHSYDFTEQTEFDIFEGGELYVFTNRLTDPIPLREFYDMTFGWEPVEVDLSPFAGRTVYLVWHHLLLSLEPAPRSGWLVDDVSISVSNVAAGTLVITNNLAQAMFSLAGPMSRSGAGFYTVLTNALPGDYQIQYSSVPYYVTPAAQTATLNSGGLLVLNGQYTFADANQNGLSDTWEQEFFGGVQPGWTGAGDTDGDGLTDFQEFIAGTNPTNALSRFQFAPPLVLPSGQVQISWPTLPGRAYLLEASTNLPQWSFLMDWTRANGAFMSQPFSPATNAPALLLRLQVRP